MTTAAEYGKVLADVIAEDWQGDPRAHTVRSWEDLDGRVDANSYFGDVDERLGITMPDTVAECEAWYYPLLTASVAVAESILWPKEAP